MSERSKKRKKRHVYEVRKDKKHGDWLVFANGAWLGPSGGWLGSRKDAVYYARITATQAEEVFGQLSELRVYRVNGTIGETRTYPRASDPKRTKG